MLAYVLVAEVGYIALGTGLGNRNGLTGAILHIMNDALMMACLFLIVGAITYKGWPRQIHQFNGLHRKMPVTMAAFVISALSVIGIPPACGFFSKWYLVLGAIDAKQWFFTAVLLVSSLLNAIIFFKVIERAYFEPVANEHDIQPVEERTKFIWDEAPLSILIPIVLLAAGILSVGLLSGTIISGIIQFALPANF
jgi:multicomponent Na+:H+ antiporter subunit D